MIVQIGRLALNEAGVVGIVTSITTAADSQTVTVIQGRTLFTDEPWIARDPHPIAPDEERKLRSVAAWWKDQQS